MTTAFLVEWDWTFVFIGSVGCFAKIFLEYSVAYAKNKRKKIITKKIIFDIISILIAGFFVYVIQVTNPWQAFIFGATWDYIFKTAEKQIMR